MGGRFLSLLEMRCLEECRDGWLILRRGRLRGRRSSSLVAVEEKLTTL